MLRILSLFLLALTLSPYARAGAPASDGRLETLQARMLQSGNIVEICVYQQTWTAPTPELPKGIFTYHAVVTRVHKGRVQVGTKIQYQRYFEEAPSYIPGFTSTVEGELKMLLFSEEDGEWMGNRFMMSGDGGFAFRFGDEFHKLFLEIVK